MVLLSPMRCDECEYECEAKDDHFSVDIGFRRSEIVRIRVGDDGG